MRRLLLLLLLLLLPLAALGQPAKPAYDVSSLAFSPDGKWLAAGDFRNQTVRLWEVKTLKPVWSRQLTGWVRSLAFSRAGDAVLAGCSDVEGGGSGRADLMDISTGKGVGELKDPDPVFCAAFSPDDHYLALADPTGVILWDIGLNTQYRFLQYSKGVSSLAFSPKGDLLAGGDLHLNVLLWDVASGQRVDRPMAYKNAKVENIHSLAFSPDGKQLASLGEYPQLWDPASGQALKALGSDNAHTGLAFSPDGATLAVAGDHPTQLWDLKSYQKSELDDLGDGLKSAVAFSPDGATLATGLTEAVALWDIKAHRKLATLQMQGVPGGQPSPP